VQSKRISDAKVQLRFEMRRPPLEATPASRRLAAHGAAVYEELGLPLKVLDVATGGGTDPAYVKPETIVPRLYLSARMIMDVSQDKVK
jgi:glutamate carboxypeptidase